MNDMNDLNDAAPAAAHPAATAALTAYAQMERSKAAHFGLLAALEEKYRRYGRPSAEENAELAGLLAEHDRCVRAFRAAVAELRAADDAAFRALMAELHAEASRATGTPTTH